MSLDLLAVYSGHNPVFQLAEAATATKTKPKRSLGQIFSKAGAKALSGGLPGAAAMSVQVLSLMWLRTTVNYQYRYGTTMKQALTTLYKEGGVKRFYNGLVPALVQGPLSRFGDTAANEGMLALMEEFEFTEKLPVAVKTVMCSVGAGAFRILLMPVDFLKTTMQVEGPRAGQVMAAKLKQGGIPVVFYGGIAASVATFVGHYPWFFTYNQLNAALPQYDELPKRLLRSAFIGFIASAVSDTCSNSIRVIKTAKQTHQDPKAGYVSIAKEILEKEGAKGLFGRGLQTKIISNGIQGLMFSVLWRLGQDYMVKIEKEKAAAAKAKADAEAAAAKGKKK